MYGQRRRLAVWAACAAGFALLLVAAAQKIAIVSLTRDPASLGGLRPWYGSLSLAALALWVCAATACLLGASVLWRLGRRDAEGTRFLLATGALAGAAAADDGLMIHEELLPVELGLPEALPTAVWLVISAGWAWRFRTYLMRSDVLLLGFTAAAFSASLIIDAVDDALGDSSAVSAYEDYCKLVGLATFAWYCWHESLNQVTKRLEPPGRPRSNT